MGRIDLSKRISLIVAATVVAGNLAFADTNKNCITDLRLNNDGNNVRVNIYTNKPYADSVVVSKKEGNKYVILVPETTSSVKSVPKVSGGGNVSVSMQTVNAGKGYTKITIVSDKSINIVPKTITATPVSTPIPKPAAKPAIKPITKPASVEKPQPKVVKQTPKPVVKKVQPVKPVNKTVTPKPVQKVVQQPVQAPPVNTVSKNKPLEILEQEVKTDKVPEIKDTKADALLEKTIKDNDEIIKQRKLKKRKGKKRYAPVVDTKLSAKECIKLVLDEAKDLSLWKLLLLASAISFPIIVIMVILGLDKRINKRINSMKKEDDIEAVERALRENVAAVRAQKALEQSSEPLEPQFNSFDEMLDKVDETLDITESYEDTDFEPEPEIVEPELVDNSDFEIEEPVVQEPVREYEPEDVVEEPPLEVVPYNPDGVLADFSNVNDKEFFDELVIQSLAEDDVDNLPDNTPADEIFGVMTEDESGILLSDFEHNNFEQETTEIETNTAPSDDVTMLNEVKINDKTGLYLVNYDNTSSLVGHIADEYFVIKNFDGVVNGNIILKQAEKTKDSERYLVRIGRNKMIVEVSDKSMSRLIDL